MAVQYVQNVLNKLHIVIDDDLDVAAPVVKTLRIIANGKDCELSHVFCHMIGEIEGKHLAMGLKGNMELASFATLRRPIKDSIFISATVLMSLAALTRCSTGITEEDVTFSASFPVIPFLDQLMRDATTAIEFPRRSCAMGKPIKTYVPSSSDNLDKHVSLLRLTWLLSPTSSENFCDFGKRAWKGWEGKEEEKMSG
ncbi:hypothetical protein BDK51DRAFT_29438, partial [Blyttiomyces helicus]